DLGDSHGRGRGQEQIMKTKEDTYTLDISENELKAFLRKLLIKVSGLFALVLLGGLLPFKGMMRAAYVIVPYCLELIFVLALLWAVFHLSLYRTSLKKREYDKSVKRLLTDTLILCLLSLVSAICSIIFVIINGFADDLFFFVLYVSVKGLMIYLSYSVRKMTDGLDFEVSRSAE
ncbi:MAG: hypothetical protein IKE38_03240, partial [Erysipelotrichaceae bacterium]|nr:hypothetical protein [Erysipelotrichaceae bacterium]